MQDDRVSIQVSDGEFPDHQSMEAILFHPEPDRKSRWQPHLVFANYITKVFSKTSKYGAIHEDSAKYTIILYLQWSNNVTEGDNFIKAIQDIPITASFPIIKLWDNILKMM